MRKHSRSFGAGFCGVLLVVLAGCTTVRGSGTISTVRRTISSFNQVAIAGAGILTITQTGVDSLTVQADDNILPAITTEVHGQRLEIGARNGTALDPTQPIRYTLTVKDLNALDISGSIYAQATGMSNLAMLTVSGSSSILASGISAASTLRVSLSGSGSVTLSGKAHTQDVTVDGSGAYDGHNLLAIATTVHTNGSVRVAVRASDTLMVEANGSSSVVYSGNPTVVVKTTGSASVSKN